MSESAAVDVYLPFYVGDFLRDTSDLSTEEIGAYALMLFHAWPKDGRVPGDQVRLARIARVDYSRWPDIWESISRFWTRDALGYYQKRMVQVRSEAMAKHHSMSEKGRAGAAAKARMRAEEQAQLELRQRTEAAQGAAGGQQSKSNSKSGSGSDPKPPTEGGASPQSLIWPAERWLELFKPLWSELRVSGASSYGNGAADTRACQTLQESIEGLPGPDVLKAQARAEAMIREYLTTSDPKLSGPDVRHSFTFFVYRWGNLRHPAASGASRRDTRCDFHQRPSTSNKKRPGGQFVDCCPECKHVDLLELQDRVGQPESLAAIAQLTEERRKLRATGGGEPAK